MRILPKPGAVAAAEQSLFQQLRLGRKFPQPAGIPFTIPQNFPAIQK
jgi:hypothetical protein